MHRQDPAARRRRWAIGAIAGLALASLVGTATVTAATDTTPPVLRAPVLTLRLGLGVGANAPVRIDALATDSGTGVPTGYGSIIAISRNGGPYGNLAWGTGMFSGGAVPYPPGVTGQWISAFRSFQRSGTYRVRVRARDRAGNWSKWVYGPTVSVRLLLENDSTFTYSGSWTRVPGPSAGGYARTSATAGATVTGTVTARSIAWVARRAPGDGLAEVWLDGVLAGTVILNNSTPFVSGRLVVFSKRWSSLGTHTIEIRVLGTGPVEFGGLLKIR